MRCELCGATATKGRRCGDCQSIPGMKLADENEREELRAYHEQLRQARGKDLDHLLATGPLPDDPQCLTDAGLAMVPILNVSLAAKELFTGSFPLGHLAITFVSTCVFAGIALLAAFRMFQTESVLFRD